MIAEIDADLAAPHPMHRLLQGDVGAGKTVVAVAALLAAVEGGHQGALMAPTEVLAEQHATGDRALLGGLEVPDDGDSLFADRPLRVELLTNRVTGAERKRVLAGLADGYGRPRHRHARADPGGASRSTASASSSSTSSTASASSSGPRCGTRPARAVPDVLVMTATPIPRTAAMTVYGDLDVSVLDELPPGPHADRDAVGVPATARRTAWAAVRGEVAAGRQAYVVCPLIEESEKLEVASAEETYDRLVGRRAARAAPRAAARADGAGREGGRRWPPFRAGELDVLVATTVIEVGVDVPNATVMVILDADRFGIAQLHQLRGRVGRGAHESQCWLVTGRAGRTATSRARGSRRWWRRPTGSSWPRSTSTCAARAR